MKPSSSDESDNAIAGFLIEDIKKVVSNSTIGDGWELHEIRRDPNFLSFYGLKNSEADMEELDRKREETATETIQSSNAFGNALPDSSSNNYLPTEQNGFQNAELATSWERQQAANVESKRAWDIYTVPPLIFKKTYKVKDAGSSHCFQRPWSASVSLGRWSFSWRYSTWKA